MKTNIKRTLSVAIILFILLQIVMPLTVKAKTNYPSPAEAEKLLAKIPDEITLDIKESEFYQKAELLVREKILKILGIPDDDEHGIMYCSIREGGPLDEDGTPTYDNTDIHKMRVSIFNSNINSTDKNAKRTSTKVIKVNYSNTKNWNQKDYEYVKKIGGSVNFNRRWDYEIYADGTSGSWQDKSDFDWKKMMEEETDKKLDDITVITDGLYAGGPGLVGGEWFRIYLIKNDIVYYVTERFSTRHSENYYTRQYRRNR